MSRRVSLCRTTLTAAIEACETMRDRLALVPKVIDVAQTLAFVHERGTASLLGALGYTAGGAIISINGVQAYDGDPSRSHALLLRGISEALGNVGWGATLAGLQAVFWALAKRRVSVARAVRTAGR